MLISDMDPIYIGSYYINWNAMTDIFWFRFNTYHFYFVRNKNDKYVLEIYHKNGY